VGEAVTGVKEAGGDEDRLGAEVAVEDVGPWVKRLSVVVPEEKVAEAYDEGLENLSRTARVAGFRKGRVPRARLLRQFGEALTGDLKSTLVTRALRELDELDEIQPVSQPVFGPMARELLLARMDASSGGRDEGEKGAGPTLAEASEEYLKALEVRRDAPFAFEFTVEVKPTFELPLYKGLELTRPVRDVTDENVERVIDGMRRSRADYVAVEEGAAEVGDRLTVTARLDVEGETVWQDEHGVAYLSEERLGGLPVELPSSEIEGLEPGGERALDVKVPDDFREEAHRGKDARLFLRLEELKRPQLGPLDDEAARELGAETAEDLRRDVRQRLELRAEAAARNALEREAQERLLEGASFDLPRGLLQRETLARSVRQVVSLARAGIGPDQLEERQKEELRAAAGESADRGLRLGLILDRIAEVEGIEATDDDVENEVYAYAVSTGRQPVKVRSELEREGRIDSIREGILRSKVLNFILELADIKDASGGAGPEAASGQGGAP
jgi:trigger factor